MATKTEILNKALTQVGAAPVTNIDDDSNNARTLSRVYKTSLESILSECKWNFATKRSSLSVLTDTLDWYDTGETYVYQKPIDMIRIFGVSNATARWREEGDYIVSDSSGLGVRYVYYIDVPSKYPAFFIDAFVDRLSADIAYSIVNSATLGKQYRELYEKISLPRAMSQNAQVGIQQTMQDDAWENAKYSNTNPNA